MKSIHIQAICAKRYRKRRRDRRGSLTPSVRREIWAKTGGTCHVCGGRAGKRWQADHVVPWQLGGSRTADNYLPICRECNRTPLESRAESPSSDHEDGCVCEERHQAQHNTRQGNDSRTSAPNGD